MTTSPLFRHFISTTAKATSANNSNTLCSSITSSASASDRSSNSTSFTLMTYNLLAQCLANSDLFPFLKKGGPTLKRKHRHPKFLAEFEYYQPDIACFQEVDEDFPLYFGSHLAKLNYDLIYEKRRIGRHGLCLLWKKDRFRKIDYKHIEFDELDFMSLPTCFPTHCISQIATFEAISLDVTKSHPKRITISNNHLFWRPWAMYEKLRQSGLALLHCLEQHKVQTSQAILICGDFNSLPSDSVYLALTKQPISEKKHCELWQVDPNAHIRDPVILHEHEKTQKKQSEDLLGKFRDLPKLKSTYGNYTTHDQDHVVTSNWQGEPTFTTYGEFSGTLDYIFQVSHEDSPEKEGEFTTAASERDSSLRATKLLQIPPLNIVKPGLPNHIFPSDHVCLMAEYEWE